MKVSNVRGTFVDYFKSRSHQLVPSSPLIPLNDPTLLFVNAGMNQFKETFLGRDERDYKRAVSIQKCVRAGGKHNDLENVGVTARHHTFFEMLGNFSFGDYFKEQAIEFAWAFLTDQLALDAERLAVTIFEGDDIVPRDSDAEKYWSHYFPTNRIYALGKKDNFWSMGDTGPCGPCSEVHFFQGNDIFCPEPKCLGVRCECDRWLEIWNLVFMQFDRQHNGSLADLPSPSVDTGMGLERITAIVEGVYSNYDTHIFRPLLTAIADRTGRSYRGTNEGQDVSFRVIADHIRAITLLMGDGVMPQNEGRGYVLRKIMRRAMLHGQQLGVKEPFLCELVGVVVSEMRGNYPDLKLVSSAISRIVNSEEERFRTTLSTGISALHEKLASTSVVASKTLPGKDAFKLYDTFGLPLDLLREIAQRLEIGIDESGFSAELEKQREIARGSFKKNQAKPTVDHVYSDLRGNFTTMFDGYGNTKSSTRTVAIIRDGNEVSELQDGQRGEVFLTNTPFYAEGGGQIGDRGLLVGPDGIADVLDTHAPISGITSHVVLISSGSLGVGQPIDAIVDETRRNGAAAHHTLTHLLHSALRETLGTHIKQAGSLVAPEKLRFDFSHFAPLTEGELEHIEGRINTKVQENLSVDTSNVPLDTALSRGALAFFGEKYGDEVRLVEISDYSIELCGGTHLKNTGQAGAFFITSESSIASGVRRIEAVTGQAAVNHLRTQLTLLNDVSNTLHSNTDNLRSTATRLRDELKQKDRIIEKLMLQVATAERGSIEDEKIVIQNVTVWTPAPLKDYEKKQHRQFVDEFKAKYLRGNWVIASAAINNDKLSLIIEVSPTLTDQIPADLLAKELAETINGRGGGRADRAEAGGKFNGDLSTVFDKIRELARSALEG